jgi:hypothetical protein
MSLTNSRIVLERINIDLAGTPRWLPATCNVGSLPAAMAGREPALVGLQWAQIRSYVGKLAASIAATLAERHDLDLHDRDMEIRTSVDVAAGGLAIGATSS